MTKLTGHFTALLSISSLLLAGCGGSSSPLSPSSSAASTAPSSSTCSASLTAAPPAFSPYGSDRSANVVIGTGCAWTAVSNASWVTISSGASGTGNGTVNYTVAANTSASGRTGTITAAGMTYTITQAGLAVPAPGADNYLDLGTPADEAFHAMTGWSAVNPGLLPGFVDPDRTSRYQASANNTADLFVSQANVPYMFTMRTEDGVCDDSFDVLVNSVKVYSYRHRQSPDTYPLHRVLLPASLITGTTVHVTIKDTTSQSCGLAAVYFIRIDS